jgi:conjugal transfer pilin signal peptidase TrbI
MNPARGTVARRIALTTRQWLAVLGCAALLVVIAIFVRIGFNATTSLHARVFLVVKHLQPQQRGEYVVFRWEGQGGFYRAGDWFTKIIAGVPGDRIEVAPDGLVLVGGRAIGRAQPFSSKGMRLEAIQPGVVPAGHFFVAGESEDSLDSRYKIVGLVPKERLVGRAYALF